MERKLKKGMIGVLVFLLLGGTVLYPYLLYSKNPFISKWRTIYIETAMTTMSHKWLATAFIPKPIIDAVLQNSAAAEEEQRDVLTDWSALEEELGKPVTGGDNLVTMFPDLDADSFEAFAVKHSDEVPSDLSRLDIDWCDESRETGIVTKQGDSVLAINVQHGVMIVRVRGEDYEGRMAICADASRVKLGVTKALFGYGQFVGDICKSYDALVGINASGFFDPNGQGNGGTPYGFVKSRGQELQKAGKDDWKIIAFDFQNHLNIGRSVDTESMRDGVEFSPALIVNGEQLIRDTAGWGLQPRTAIGQKADKTVLMLAIDGRQPGYSLGATLLTVTEKLLEYQAVQACNLDGGSSTIMHYNGRTITHPTNRTMNQSGRVVPDAFYVA